MPVWVPRPLHHKMDGGGVDQLADGRTGAKPAIAACIWLMKRAKNSGKQR